MACLLNLISRRRFFRNVLFFMEFEIHVVCQIKCIRCDVTARRNRTIACGPADNKPYFILRAFAVEPAIAQHNSTSHQWQPLTTVAGPFFISHLLELPTPPAPTPSHLSPLLWAGPFLQFAPVSNPLGRPSCQTNPLPAPPRPALPNPLFRLRAGTRTRPKRETNFNQNGIC